MDKKITFSSHALGQMIERGTHRQEVETAILKGEKIPAKQGRHGYRINFQYGQFWGEKWYPIKQVMPIIKEEKNEFIVITVYVFYF